MAKWSEVLIVEDDLVSQKLMRLIFQKLGLNTFAVSNYNDAIAYLMEKSPSIVVVDIGLPGLKNGNDLIKTMKVNAGWRFIPLLIITAGNMKDHLVELLEPSRDLYLNKPIDVHDVKIYLTGISTLYDN